MNRNLNSHFSLLPDADIRRSRMDRNCSIKTSLSIGDCIPFYVDEVLPGDSFQIKTNLVARMQPMVTAPMDDLWLDTYYFYVPSRLVWTHLREFHGENTESAWYPTVEYNIPQLNSGPDGFEIGSIADYMGLPVGVPNISVSALPFRAYSLIMNEWFRSESLVDPLETPTGDATQTYYKMSNAYNPAQYANGGRPFVAAKAHDYFTSCLPDPLRHEDVALPLGTADNAIVYTGALHNNNGSTEGLSYGLYNRSSNPIESGGGSMYFPGLYDGHSTTWNIQSKKTYKGGSDSLTDRGVGLLTASSSPQPSAYLEIYPNNLYADVNIAPVTINDLRQAIALQHLYEIDARHGGRYVSILKAHFGVTSPDARLQRPEYLGGNRISINVNQVVQNSASTDDSPIGHVAGQSVTSDSHGDFMQSFTEHGYIIGIAVARYAHTYQQGIERFWSRKSRFDFFYPALANVGEMAVLNKELYATGTPADDEVFGYQEAWSDYRHKPSRCTGEMRSNHPNSLDSWHFADVYSSQPYLSAEWLQEDKNNVDRALAVTSKVAHQMWIDFYIQNETTRPMPIYSIPGLERI